MALRCALATVLCLLLLAGPARADALLPPAGKACHGVTGGGDLGDFVARAHAQPAVRGQWVQWGESHEYAFRRAGGDGARVMLHISTARGQGMAGRISPGRIARGHGDDYLLALNRRLDAHDGPAYLRLMGEMNNCDNAYAALDCSGSRRSADHSARRFKQAWRRAVLVVRGGEVRRIDARLRSLGLPPVDTDEDALPTPRVAFVWSPMTGGSPMVPALAPGVYWPGGDYVDWVGTSFYSRFPNFHFLEPFYRRFAVGERKPFAFAEWAMWGSDDPAFARRLFAWVGTHERVRMLQYNQGENPSGPFRLRRFPRAAAVIRRGLASPRFARGHG